MRCLLPGPWPAFQRVADRAASLTLPGLWPWRAAFQFVSHTLGRNPAAAGGNGDPVIIFADMDAERAAVAPLAGIANHSTLRPRTGPAAATPRLRAMTMRGWQRRPPLKC